MKINKLVSILAAMMLMPAAATAATYDIDIEGQHAFIDFKVNHLGFAWLHGRFNDFDGHFTFDPENPEAASAEVTIETASVDSNHAERDRHLRSDDFLHVDEYPEARFVSTESNLDSDGNGTVTGELTLHGTTREVTLDVEHIGAGEDPWGGVRRGFYATTTFDMRDFGIDEEGNLGDAGRDVKLSISVEGIQR